MRPSSPPLACYRWCSQLARLHRHKPANDVHAAGIPSGRTRRCLHSERSRCVPRCPWGTNNLNNPGPLQKGRREINWDGGNPNLLDTTAPVNPFLVFLNTRGSQFKTPGLGLSQAPPSGGPQGGLAVLFGNPNLRSNLQGVQPSRLFTPVGSNITEASFSIPGTNGNAPATVRGFGAVFTDVDQPDGRGALAATARNGSTLHRVLRQERQSFYSAVSFRPRRATEACPSSASSLMTPASRRSGSRPATLPRGRMTIASMTSS